MRVSSRARLLPLATLGVAVSLALTMSACSGKEKNPDVLAQDSSLSRDLALANENQKAEPQLTDVPATTPPAPAPAAPAPAPKPVVRPKPPAPVPTPRTTPKIEAPTPKPEVTPSGNTVVKTPAASSGTSTEGKVGVVSAGTTLALAAGQKVCTNTNTVGDRFTATLSNAITASNGVVIPAGATAIVEVTGLKRSEQAGDKMNIGLAVRSITYGGKTYPISGQIADAQVEKVRGNDNNDAAKVAGGAVVGAILGRVLGGKNKTKGTVIGAAGGAAAGAVLAQQTANYDACIPSGGRISVRLDQPLSIQGPAGSAAESKPLPNVDPNQI